MRTALIDSTTYRSFRIHPGPSHGPSFLPYPMQASSRANPAWSSGRSNTAPTLLIAACSAIVLSLSGCSSVNDLLSPDKVDYKTSGSQTVKLDVPPDLSQLNRESRYQTASGTVSASELQKTQPSALGTAATHPTPVAVKAVGALRIERSGDQRWLVTDLTPEALWPQLQAFWQEQGFALALQDQALGVMETEWSENRAKLKADVIRNVVGRLLDSLYDTGERDRFRTRIERSGSSTEIYISHRGLEEVYTSAQKDQTKWQARPSDSGLEAEFLARLMVKLGAKPEAAKTEVAGSASGPARARLVEGSATSVMVDDGFDSAWRRVGLALDRNSFSVEDRDRSQGLYFVRYVDPTQDRKSEPGFLGRIFGFGGSDGAAPVRYRISVKTSGANSTTVTVLNDKGETENSETTRRIAGLLVDELR